MIPNLMTRVEFENCINVSNPFVSRTKSIKDIAQSIENAHRLQGRPAQFIALLGLRTLTHSWKIEHGQNSKSSWKFSVRGQGVMMLELEIEALFQGAFQKEFGEFKAGLRNKMARVSSALKTITGHGAPSRPAKQFANTMRQLSTNDYILEFLEPKHRADATLMKTLWDNPVENPNNMSFGAFVDSLDADLVQKIDQMSGKQPGDYNWVKYLDDGEREQVELRAMGADNIFKRPMDKDVFDTAEHRSNPHREGWSIFVMDEHNKIYTESKRVKQFHHSSFLGGRPTKSAGTLKVIEGRIAGITMASGHYAPGPVQALAICRVLLTRFSGNSAAELKLNEITDASRKQSTRAQGLLGKILICPDFENKDFYNALEYLKVGGNTNTLQRFGDSNVV